MPTGSKYEPNWVGLTKEVFFPSEFKQKTPNFQMLFPAPKDFKNII